jgi:hypothetical protein
MRTYLIYLPVLSYHIKASTNASLHKRHRPEAYTNPYFFLLLQHVSSSHPEQINPLLPPTHRKRIDIIRQPFQNQNKPPTIFAKQQKTSWTA